MHERMNKVNEILEKDLKDKMDKIVSAGTITPEDIKILDCAVDLMLDFKNYESWEMNGNGNSYGYSASRGRNQMTGRYMSRDVNPYDMGYSSGMSYGNPYYNGYSGHGETIEKLMRMRDDASTDYERQMFSEMINRLSMNK